MKLALKTISFGSRCTNFYSFGHIDGSPLPEVEPGAHITLHLPNGLERQYSLIRREPSAQWHIAVKRDPEGGGGSAWLHDQARVGMAFMVDGPRNHFPLVEDSPATLLIAGGIGITPLYAMAHRLRDLGRPFELHYTIRSRQDAILLDELSTWPNVHLRIGEECGGKPFPLAEIVAAAPAHAHLYCCGPNGMLEDFEAAGKASSRLSSHMHVEYFSPKFEAATEGGYSIELARSKTELIVPPGRTILDVLLDSGIYASHSCSEGVCGACETTVLAGIPDHRDSILTEEEKAANSTMMICCSGARSDKLVLDL